MPRTPKSLWFVTVTAFICLGLVFVALFFHGCKKRPKAANESKATTHLAICVEPEDGSLQTVDVMIWGADQAHAYTLEARDGDWLCARIKEPKVIGGFGAVTIQKPSTRLRKVEVRIPRGQEIAHFALEDDPGQPGEFTFVYTSTDILRLPTVVVGTKIVSTTPLFQGDKPPLD